MSALCARVIIHAVFTVNLNFGCEFSGSLRLNAQKRLNYECLLPDGFFEGFSILFLLEVSQNPLAISNHFRFCLK
jgi:hypothetical protein